jgi:flagellar motor switch protein FliN
MSPQDVTPRDALLRLGASTAEAIAQVLETFAPGAVERGEVTVQPEGASPFAGLPRGTVATSVSYIDGVTGANVFTYTPASARALARAMGVPVDEGDGEAPLSELELSAVAEAANQTMAAAASAIGVVIGQEIEISPPDTRVLEDPAAASDAFGSAPHATSTTFRIGGESCRLIQLVPSAFVMRMARAIEELGEGSAEAKGTDAQDGATTMGLREALGGITLRVWAELGRTRMPLGQALALPLGAVVDLDRAAEAPVDLYVNGLRFARGELVVSDGEWAVSLSELTAPGILAHLALEAHGPESADPEPQPEGALI